MNFSINHVIISGNVTQDPELATTPNGNSVLTLNVATNRSVFNKDTNEYTDFPTYHRVKVWGKIATTLINQISKGDPVTITGRIDNGTYEKNDGTKGYYSEIVADEVIATKRNKTSRVSDQQSAEYDRPNGAEVSNNQKQDDGDLFPTDDSIDIDELLNTEFGEEDFS